MFVVLAGLFQSGEGPCFMLLDLQVAATWVLADARKLLDCRVASLLAMTGGETGCRGMVLVTNTSGRRLSPE